MDERIIEQGRKIVADLLKGDQKDNGPHIRACDFLKRHAGISSELHLMVAYESYKFPPSKNPTAASVLANFLDDLSSGIYEETHEIDPPAQPFVSQVRIQELRTLKSNEFDFRRLIRLCEELNVSISNGSFLASSMLTRSIIDHVSPIFKKGNFTEVANHHSGGGKSFKDAAKDLNDLHRTISNTWLHQQIRNKEVLPSFPQINCAVQLDILLGEVVRISR